jgi:hypothetical protein
MQPSEKNVTLITFGIITMVKVRGGVPGEKNFDRNTVYLKKRVFKRYLDSKFSYIMFDLI